MGRTKMDAAREVRAGLCDPAQTGTGGLRRVLDRAAIKPASHSEECEMNWNIAKDHWKQFKGKVKARWDKLTDDELETVAGERDELVGCIQERYGVSRAAAEGQLVEFERKVSRVHH